MLASAKVNRTDTESINTEMEGLTTVSGISFESKLRQTASIYGTLFFFSFLNGLFFQDQNYNH